jgi:hypothetical protein
VSYPTRQRHRRLAKALKHSAGALFALLLAGMAAHAGFSTLALLLFVCAGACGLRSWRWLRLARRSAIGERSERHVRARLQALEREGWTVRHSLCWPGTGDIDHLAIAPSAIGMAFAIETKTYRYAPSDLARTTEVARWSTSSGAERTVQAAVPVLCLASARRVERWEAGVVVVSAELLTPVLSRLAGTTRKPGFLR